MTRRRILEVLGIGAARGALLPATFAQNLDGTAKAKSASSILVGSRRQLLCDQVLLSRGSWQYHDWPTGIRWTVGSVEKSPEPIYIPHLPWEKGCFYWPHVLYDGGRYRLWYNAAADETLNGKTQEYDKVAYAESDDGIQWRMPELGIIDWNGSKRNNIVYNADREHGGIRAHGPAPFIDPIAKPSERYKMVYGDNLGKEDTTGGLTVLMGAYSSDGLDWKRYPEVFMINPDAQSGVGYDLLLRKYVAYVRGTSDYGEVSIPGAHILKAPRGRAIQRIESEDFHKWSFPEPCLAGDIYDPLDMDFYTNGYSPYPFADQVHFMFMGSFHQGPQRTNIQVAVSRDNNHWYRPTRDVFINNGPEGGYDAGMIYVSPSLVDIGGDRLALYTQVATLGKDSETRQRSPYHGFAMGRVTFRRDRIIGIEADEQQGSFATRDLVFEGKQLRINAEPTAANGRLQVELLSLETGQPCAGYTFEDCDPIRVDAVNATATWRGSSDTGAWANKTVRLKFRLQSMRVYAFEFTT